MQRQAFARRYELLVLLMSYGGLQIAPSAYKPEIDARQKVRTPVKWVRLRHFSLLKMQSAPSEYKPMFVWRALQVGHSLVMCNGSVLTASVYAAMTNGTCTPACSSYLPCTQVKSCTMSFRLPRNNLLFLLSRSAQTTVLS